MRNIFDCVAILGETKRNKTKVVRNEMNQLTPRQATVASLHAQGMDSKQVAEALGIAVNTARVTLQQARERVGARNVAHLVAISISKGFIQTLCIALVVSSLLSPFDAVRSKTSLRLTRRPEAASHIA
ncbi:MAG TPA: helix-turn-helix transcriptional regulator [Modicisalibacter sp.]|nr:helix-turn-helix transcriptional regulator [Modicisalibacter sp.]